MTDAEKILGECASILDRADEEEEYVGDTQTRQGRQISKGGRRAVVVKKVNSPLRVGNKVLIRTVTHYWVGRVVSLSAGEIVLAEAAWVADTGRWHEALDTGKLNEVEVSKKSTVVSINRGALVDCVDWSHELPSMTK